MTGRRYVAFLAAVTVAAAAGLALTRGPGAPPPGSYLRTVASAGGPDGAGDTQALAIVRTREGGEPIRLARDFASAWSPSPDFPGRRVLFVGRRRSGEAAAIWETTIEGERPRKVTAGHGAPDTPVYLPGGRIAFSDVPEDAAEAGAGVRSLFSCAADGGDPVRLTFAPRRDGRPEVLSDGRLRYESRGLGDGTDVRLMTVHPDGTQVAAFPVGESALGAAIPATAPLAPRRAPGVLTSLVDPSRETGTLLCLDSQVSRMAEVAGLPRGAIRAVRVSRARAGAQGPDEVLGEAPVLEDGSFFVTVPADVPLRLALLAADGKVLAGTRGGLWVRPNENRGCIGCHEPEDQAPENRRPLAVTHGPSTLAATVASTGAAAVAKEKDGHGAD